MAVHATTAEMLTAAHLATEVLYLLYPRHWDAIATPSMIHESCLARHHLGTYVQIDRLVSVYKQSARVRK
jgi:hypothetical protein